MKGLKSNPILSFSIPTPVSCISNCRRFSYLRWTLIMIYPFLVNFKPLETKLIKILFRRIPSVLIYLFSKLKLANKQTFLFLAVNSNSENVSSMIFFMLHLEKVINKLPFTIFEWSKMSLIVARSNSQLFKAILMYFFPSDWFSTFKKFSKRFKIAVIQFKGVRKSWFTEASILFL